MSGDRFTAWAMCPACESVDCHWLRLPDKINAEGPLAMAFHQIEWMSWGMSGKRMPTSMQQRYEVIRTCKKCENEWGQQ